MTRHARLLTIGTLLGLLSGQAVLAQTAAEQAAAEARIQAGPVALTPRFTLRDIGVDTNVLNADSGPQKDFTATFGPALDSWMGIGRVWISSESSVEWVYFKDSTEQRSVNLGQDTRVDLDLTRVVPHVSFGYERTRRRPNLEIDARVRHTTTVAAAGFDVRLGPSTSVDLEVRELTVDFGEEAFGDESLARALNRRSEQVGIQVRHRATPLTTFVFKADRSRDRFDFDSLRDSESVTFAPGLEFEPLALISGQAFVGMRRFDISDSQVPDFRGVIAEVDVAYTVRDVARLTVRTARDIEYSFEPFEPYYVSTGGEIEVTLVVGLNWDVVARGGRTALAYEAVVSGLEDLASGRRDVIDSWGVGIGRHLGEETRFGVSLSHVARRSDRIGRSYSGLRTGASLTYGF